MDSNKVHVYKVTPSCYCCAFLKFIIYLLLLFIMFYLKKVPHLKG